MVVQHGQVGRVVVAAAAVAVLVCATAGCSGGGAAADSRRAAHPVDAVRDAARVLVGQGSSRASTAMEMAAGGTRVTIRGEGVYDYRARLGRLRVVLPPDPAGTEEHRPITELLAPGALYMKNRGAGVPVDKWVRVDTASLSDGNLVTGGATDPLTAAQILAGARRVAYLGEAVVAGTPVRHYRGVADLVRAARAADSGTQARVLAAAAHGLSVQRVPFDAYLDDDGRIRKLRHRFSYDNGRTDRPVAVTSVTLLYDFGAPVVVRLPDPQDIYAGKIAES
ncbi:lipoprotein [Streptomyces sulfonofaciens]|uniref:Lipoprotein n=1 Tax=Streptomyces sulfonofaciens TaxID=68272 RepID=A0A919L902_9ACTN|nr:hypothetical protein [Streptomyces sulfonofaciens]GHH87864.1 lipoprotein [Streptomyces sulfonofaciens]